MTARHDLLVGFRTLLGRRTRDGLCASQTVTEARVDPNSAEFHEQNPRWVDIVQVLSAVTDQAGCAQPEAERMLNWLQELIDEMRQRGDSKINLTSEQMSSPEYRLFALVFEQRVATPERCLAATLIERRLLVSAPEGTRIWHYRLAIGCRYEYYIDVALELTSSALWG